MFSPTILNRSVDLCYQFQNLNLLHFDQILGLKSLSIYCFLLARLNLGLQMDRLPVQASPEAQRSERDREKPVKAVLVPTSRALWARGAGSLSGDGTYLPGTVGQGCRLFKWCQKLPPRHCGAGMQALKQCWNLPPGQCGAGVPAV